MATQLSRETAAQAWCKPATKDKVMDAELAEAFAEILDEIKARVGCNYRTAGPHTECPSGC